MTLILIIAVLLIAVYLLAPGPQDTKAAGMEDFNFPDNSVGKPIPRLYGFAKVFGNCIYAGGLRSGDIEICP